MGNASNKDLQDPRVEKRETCQRLAAAVAHCVVTPDAQVPPVFSTSDSRIRCEALDAFVNWDCLHPRGLGMIRREVQKKDASARLRALYQIEGDNSLDVSFSNSAQ